jgi:hypothetical protein
MGQRSNDAAVKDAQNKFVREEYARRLIEGGANQVVFCLKWKSVLKTSIKYQTQQL